MALSRRDFIKYAGMVSATAMLPMGFSRASTPNPQFIPQQTLNLAPVPAYRSYAQPLKRELLKRTRMDAIIDPVEGRLIGEFNLSQITKPTDTASLAKIVTYMLVQDHLAKGKTVAGTPLTLKTKLKNVTYMRATRRGRVAHIPLRNDDLNIDDGLKFMMGLSVNQVARALGMNVLGVTPKDVQDEINAERYFVELMNEKARHLGLANTAFINSSGLPGRDSNHIVPETKKMANVSTIEDLSKLAVVMTRMYPDHVRYTSQREYKISQESIIDRMKMGITDRRNPTFKSTNPLYKDEFLAQSRLYNVSGLKTGTTNKAGRTAIITGQRDNNNLVVLTYGHPLYDQKNRFIREADDPARAQTSLVLLEKNNQLLNYERSKKNEHLRQLTNEIW